MIQSVRRVRSVLFVLPKIKEQAMRLLSIVQKPNLRDIYPGEIRVSLSRASDDGGATWYPAGLSISVQYENGSDCHRDSWRLVDLVSKKGEPYRVEVDLFSDVSPEEVLVCASRDLKLFFGDELASELNAAMLHVLVQDANVSGSRESVDLRLKFNRFSDYTDLFLHLSDMVSWPRWRREVTPFDRDAFALKLANSWQSYTWTRAVKAQLAYYDEHRPDDAESRYAYDKEVDDFRQLVVWGTAGTQELKDSVESSTLSMAASST